MDVFLYLDINGNSLEQITVAMSNQKRFSETKPNVRILEKSSCFLGESEKKTAKLYVQFNYSSDFS